VRADRVQFLSRGGGGGGGGRGPRAEGGPARERGGDSQAPAKAPPAEAADDDVPF
jgi:single-stranded DNA-binding protein